MLRLLTLEDYLKVMTVDEQERIFRDGQPFTAEDIERWRALLASREQTYTEIFTNAMNRNGRIKETE